MLFCIRRLLYNTKDSKIARCPILEPYHPYTAPLLCTSAMHQVFPSRMDFDSFINLLYTKESVFHRGVYSTEELFSWVSNQGIDKPELYLLIDRAARKRILTRLFHGIYLLSCSTAPAHRLAVRTVQLLRPNSLSYVSMESILFSAGAIKTPPSSLTIVTTGAPGFFVLDGMFSIELFRVRRQTNNILPHLTKGEDGLWYASAQLAFRDLKKYRPNHEAVDMRILDDEIRQMRLVG